MYLWSRLKTRNTSNSSKDQKQKQEIPPIPPTSFSSSTMGCLKAVMSRKVTRKSTWKTFENWFVGSIFFMYIAEYTWNYILKNFMSCIFQNIHEIIYLKNFISCIFQNIHKIIYWNKSHHNISLILDWWDMEKEPQGGSWEGFS